MPNVATYLALTTRDPRGRHASLALHRGHATGRQRLVAIAVALSLLALVVAMTGRAGVAPDIHRQTSAQSGLSSLPVAARGPASAALGSSDREVLGASGWRR